MVGAERIPRISRTLLALQDTTAEIRVRGALALLMLFAAIATRFGLEAILGALAERRSRVLAAGLLQARSPSIPVVAGAIGVELGLICPNNYVALVTAGLLTVLSSRSSSCLYCGGRRAGWQPD